MSKLWSSNSPLMRKFALLPNLLCLNILWIIFSLPIIKIGASTTALYAALFPLLQDEADSVIKPFLSAFKRNFKQSTLLWLPMCLVIAVLMLDVFYILSQNASGFDVMWLPVIFVAILTGITMSYGFPQIALFDNKLRIIIRNGYQMFILNLLPSAAIFAVNLLPWILPIFAPDFFSVSAPIWFLFGFSLCAYLNSYLLMHVFKKYMPVKE